MLIWANRQQEHPWLFPDAERSALLLRLHRHLRLIEPPTVVEQVVWSIVLASTLLVLFRLLRPVHFDEAGVAYFRRGLRTCKFSYFLSAIRK